DTLARMRELLSHPAAPAGWDERLRQLLQGFFLADNEREEAVLDRLVQALDEWLEHCEQADLSEALPLAVVREAWLAGLDRDRLSRRFLAGSVNVCTLMPMRAIPFRVVCLLGMNDGDYPR